MGRYFCHEIHAMVLLHHWPLGVELILLATWGGADIVAVFIGQGLAKNDPAMFQVANLVGGNGWFYNRKGMLSFSKMLSHTQKGKQNILVVLILTL